MKKPLVSIIVVAYNSSKTIEETLESILTQTYDNIEVIIADDCSIDNKIEIYNRWKQVKYKKCVRIEILKSYINKGTTVNCNRGAKAAHGVWIKFIAADDLLLPECISSNIKYIEDNKDANLVFSKLLPFGNEEIINKNNKNIIKGYSYLMLNERDFFIMISISNCLPAPTAFINKSMFDSLCGFDENIPLIEDWPFWIKAAYNKIQFYYNPIETVKYRMSGVSISLGGKSQLYIESEKKAKKYAVSIQKKTNIFLWLYCKCLYNKKKWKKFIYFPFVCFNPISYYIQFIKFKIYILENNGTWYK